MSALHTFPGGFTFLSFSSGVVPWTEHRSVVGAQPLECIFQFSATWKQPSLDMHYMKENTVREDIQASEIHPCSKVIC